MTTLLPPTSPSTGAAPFQPDAAGPGLYVHIPFCSAICPYCDFSVLKGGEEAKERFLQTLLAEVDLVAEQGGLWAEGGLGREGASPTLTPQSGVGGIEGGASSADTVSAPFDTLYLGGGTPTALTSEQLHRLLEHLRRRLPVAPDARLFLEANPEDVRPEPLAEWRQLGVTFLSLGVQSFDDDALAFLGRRHNGNQATRAVEEALEAGFETVSLDLIFGYRGHSEELWLRDLDRASALGTQHLSAYQLTLHEGTPFGFRHRRGETLLVEEDPQARLFALAQQHLRDGGLAPYEVSNYAVSGAHRSQHNQKYWHHVPYLGIGPSAHSYWPQQKGESEAAPTASMAPSASMTRWGALRGRRFWNHRKVGPWTAAIEAGELPVAGDEHLGADSLALEAVLLSLRTVDGVNLDRLQQRFGIDLLAQNQVVVASLAKEGFLGVREQGGERFLQPTPQGLAVADALVGRLAVELPG